MINFDETNQKLIKYQNADGNIKIQMDLMKIRLNVRDQTKIRLTRHRFGTIKIKIIENSNLGIYSR